MKWIFLFFALMYLQSLSFAAGAVYPCARPFKSPVLKVSLPVPYIHKKNGSLMVLNAPERSADDYNRSLIEKMGRDNGDKNFALVAKKADFFSHFIQHTQNSFLQKLAFHFMKDLVFAHLDYKHLVKTFIGQCKAILEEENNFSRNPGLQFLAAKALKELAKKYPGKSVSIIQYFIRQVDNHFNIPNGVVLGASEVVKRQLWIEDIASIVLEMSDEGMQKQIKQYLKNEYNQLLSSSANEKFKIEFVKDIIIYVQLQEIDFLFPGFENGVLIKKS